MAAFTSSASGRLAPSVPSLGALIKMVAGGEASRWFGDLAVLPSQELDATFPVEGDHAFLGANDAFVAFQALGAANDNYAAATLASRIVDFGPVEAGRAGARRGPPGPVEPPPAESWAIVAA